MNRFDRVVSKKRRHQGHQRLLRNSYIKEELTYATFGNAELPVPPEAELKKDPDGKVFSASSPFVSRRWSPSDAGLPVKRSNINLIKFRRRKEEKGSETGTVTDGGNIPHP